MTGVAVAGIGADRLADLIVARGVDVDTTGCHAAILVIDPTSDVGSEEFEALDSSADDAVPTALVICDAERDPDWPAAAARAREALDPDRRLALFAVSVADGAGVDDLVEWCGHPDTGPPVRGARSSPTAMRPLPAVASSAAPSSAAPRSEPGPGRSERLTGLRAGLAAARTEAVTAARESAQALAVSADQACSRVRRRDNDAYCAWVVESLDAVSAVAETTLDERIRHVRRVAAIGLPGMDTADVPVGPVAASIQAPPRRSGGAEDALVLLLGVTAGFGAGRMLVAPIVEGWFLGGVVTAAVGLLLAAWVVGVRRTAGARTALRRWTVDTVGLSRTALEHRLVARVAAVEAHAGREIWNRTAARRV